MPDQPLPASRQHRFRFRVRDLILLVLVFGASLGWMVRSARIQRDAVAAIESAGGSVYYDWQWTPGDHWALADYRPGGKPRRRSGS